MSRWIEDPQGREEVEKVTRFLKLPVWKPQYLGKFREFWNELWEKIDTNAEASALTLSGKEDSFPKSTAFNKDFGVAREQVLEGAKLAEILGIPYGGLLNNNTTKKRGLGYYCTVNESIYKCKEDTQLNYAESNYFDAISNDDLLGKLQNLDIFGTWGRFGKYTKLSFLNKVQQLNIPGDYDPLKLVNNYLEVDLSTYFSEISTVVVTPNVIQSQTTLSTTVTETQITGTIVRVKFLMLNTSGSLIVPTSSFRFSINVSGILK